MSNFKIVINLDSNQTNCSFINSSDHLSNICIYWSNCLINHPIILILYPIFIQFKFFNNFFYFFIQKLDSSSYKVRLDEFAIVGLNEHLQAPAFELAEDEHGPESSLFQSSLSGSKELQKSQRVFCPPFRLLHHYSTSLLILNPIIISFYKSFWIF